MDKPENAPLIWSDRWRLGALSRAEVMNIFYASVLIGFLMVLFHLFGNRVENVNSSSAFTWMFARWGDKESFGEDYSHGYLIPFVSLWVIWYKRKEIKTVPKRVCHWGLALIVIALASHWVGAKMQQTRISLLALILLLWGIPLYFWGWQLAKLMIFPASYLIFCVPLNFLNALSGPLQRLAVAGGYSVIHGLGIECQKVGTMLTSDYFELNVEAACSGLRSLLAMTALTAVYAFFTQRTFVKKWLLFMLSIPIAVVGNMGRIVSIALVSITTGQKYAASLHHDYAGYMFFAIAIGMMVGSGKLISLSYREMFLRWKKAFLNRS